MKTRKIGDITVSAIGMGCMGFSTAYGKIPEESESIRLMRKAHEMGCTFYDTAEIYATFRNEELVGKALKPIRNEIVLATKYSPAPLLGQDKIPGGKLSRNGVRVAVEDSLKRLQTDHIDIYYAHRVPAEADPEEMANWFGELIREGKILSWGGGGICRPNSQGPRSSASYGSAERVFDDGPPVGKRSHTLVRRIGHRFCSLLTNGRWSAQRKIQC